MGRSREEDIIATLRAAAGSPPPPQGIGDDGAVLEVRDDGARVITTDAMVEGVHFLRPHPPSWLGAKLLAVNLSDVAAMGARPEGFVVTAALPRDTPPGWWSQVSQGIAAYAQRSGATLVGGDTVASPGPVVLSVTAWGRTEGPEVLTRAGGQVGDVLLVHGPVGLSHAGLQLWRSRCGDVGIWPSVSAPTERSPEEVALRAHLRPDPDLSLGPWALTHAAHAGMDLSDGLFADVSRLATASGLELRVELDRLPAQPGCEGLSPVERAAGGEDLGLAVLVAPAAAAAFESHGFVRIGHAVAAGGSASFTHEGVVIEGQEPAFTHFGGLSS